MSVADNARIAVLLHVSASSERQEWGNETGGMMKTTESHILTQSNDCGSSVLFFYRVVHLVVQETWYITHTHTHTHTHILTL
jgi:hypothetical protein